MKNKKILIIALFLILFCLLGYSKCFASLVYTDSEGNSGSFPDVPELEGYPNYLVYYSKHDPLSTVRILYYIDDANIGPRILSEKNGTVFVVYLDSVPGSGYGKFYECKEYFLNNGVWKLSGSGSGGFNIFGSGVIVASTKDVVNYETGDVVFPVPPQVQGIVAQQVEEIQLSQALQEVIAILPKTLVVLVSLVGLRKGLKMLETFLHQS